MSKGIEVQCSCCGTAQDVTEMMSYDIFGFTLPQVQKILHDYREQVPHAEAVARRLSNCQKTRIVMHSLLNRIVRGPRTPADQFQLSKDIATFLAEVAWDGD